MKRVKDDSGFWPEKWRIYKCLVRTIVVTLTHPLRVPTTCFESACLLAVASVVSMVLDLQEFVSAVCSGLDTL